MIGRGLNLRLAELKMDQVHVMSDREHLLQLFEAERNAMLEHLDDVATAAKRMGRPSDIRNVELDLENG